MVPPTCCSRRVEEGSPCGAYRRRVYTAILQPTGGQTLLSPMRVARRTWHALSAFHSLPLHADRGGGGRLLQGAIFKSRLLHTRFIRLCIPVSSYMRSCCIWPTTIWTEEEENKNEWLKLQRLVCCQSIKFYCKGEIFFYDSFLVNY